MTGYKETLRNLPIVIQRLRRRAGHETQRSALRAIRRKTGVGLTPARLSEWESGRTTPSLRSLIAFLMGLGYDLKDFQDEVDFVVADPHVTPPPARKQESLEERSARQLAELEAYQRKLDKLGKR